MEMMGRIGRCLGSRLLPQYGYTRTLLTAPMVQHTPRAFFSSPKNSKEPSLLEDISLASSELPQYFSQQFKGKDGENKKSPLLWGILPAGLGLGFLYNKYFKKEDPAPKPSTEEYHKHLANHKNADSQYTYALHCKKKGNLEEAKRYAKLAADQGYAPAQAFYSILCFDEKNFSETKRYAKLAADQGNPQGLFLYGGCLERFSPTDIIQARQNFKLSADQKYPPAQYKYARMCENGKGGEKDLNAALYYYKLAAENGIEQAQKRLEKLLRSQPSLKRIR